jgi:hypothetical protein
MKTNFTLFIFIKIEKKNFLTRCRSVTDMVKKTSSGGYSFINRAVRWIRFSKIDSRSDDAFSMQSTKN